MHGEELQMLGVFVEERAPDGAGDGGVGELLLEGVYVVETAVVKDVERIDSGLHHRECGFEALFPLTLTEAGFLHYGEQFVD